MTQRIEKAGLQIGKPLYDLIERALPGTGVASDTFWQELAALVAEFGPKNAELIARRREIQEAIDGWHREHRGTAFDRGEYKQLLEKIGYFDAAASDFQVSTAGVDPEIASVPGPQLVVPVTNARFSLNAANARWGSLYDALYGADVIPESQGAEKGTQYNPKRGAKVFAWAAAFLDETFPLAEGSHANTSAYTIDNGRLAVVVGTSHSGLRDPEQFVGYRGSVGAPSAVLLVNHGLHAEIQIDAHDPIGQDHAAGVKDVLMEAAVTTIQDCEDSVAAVDAEDKALVYGNWLGLMQGDLEARVTKAARPSPAGSTQIANTPAPTGPRCPCPGAV